MHSWVQCYLATGNERIKNYAKRRLHEVVDVHLPRPRETER